MIEKLDISELDSVMKIWIEENIKAHKFIPDNYWKQNHDFVKRALPKSDVFTLKKHGEIKGFIGILENSYIAGLFVSSKYQSNGIGSKLLGECKQKYPSLALDVYAKNTKALEFYKKHGFTIKGEKKNPDTSEVEYSMVWSI